MSRLKRFLDFTKRFHKKDELGDFYKNIAKKYNLPYKKVGERIFSMGPRDGYEFIVSVGADACHVQVLYNDIIIRSSMVFDLDKYLLNFDFSEKNKN